MNSSNTFLHDAFDLLEQTRVLLIDPVGQVSSVIQDLTRETKTDELSNCTIFVAVKHKLSWIEYIPNQKVLFDL